jgi:hypothetical protein
VRIRKIIPASEGVSVASFMDETIVEQQEMFNFRGTDQMIVNFRLEEKTPDVRTIHRYRQARQTNTFL